MKEQAQPNGWSCLPTSFAMVLEVDVKDIFGWLDHDGSEIIWPELPEPLCRRAFHIQEMVDYCMAADTMVTPIEFCPCLQPTDESLQFVINLNHGLSRIQKYLRTYRGVLAGVLGNGNRHCVAWSHPYTFDPAQFGRSALLPTDFQIDTFYIVQ